MKEFVYTIKEPVGIHARPAGMLAKEAKLPEHRYHRGQERQVR